MVSLYKAYNLPVGLSMLECGSHKEGEETKLFRSLNNCYYIEANTKDYEIMKRQQGVRPENVFNYALSDTDGEVEFTVVEDSGCSSFHHLREHLDELQKASCVFNKIKVPSISYKSFLEKIQTTIDILILDVEGSETIILKGMKHLPVEKLPKIINIEAGYDWLTRKALLLELGYVLDYYDYNNVICHHSSVNVQKNEEFIRRKNLENPRFIWYNEKAIGSKEILIYENDLV